MREFIKMSAWAYKKQNETFNGMIWNRVPKANLVGAAILNLGVYYATVHFKDGAISSLEILKRLWQHTCILPDV